MANCDPCEQRVTCNPPNVKCWKTEVRVAACGISATDFPYLDSGINQSSSLVLSAYPNTEGIGKRGCLVLNDDCCNNIQTLGVWASLSIPKCLHLNLTINLNDGTSQDFTTTTGINTLTPCNVSCYDKSTPIWLAPSGAQPAPCLTATLLQTISQCNKTICWTVNLDCTNDSVGAAVIESIVDVGCTKLVSTSGGCPGCHEAFDVYDVFHTPNSEKYSQAFVASGYYNLGDCGSVFNHQHLDQETGSHQIILTKGTIIEGEYTNTDTFTEQYLRTLTTQVGLYPCQIFNFWAAVYSRPRCVNNHLKPDDPVPVGPDGRGGNDPIVAGGDPNNKAIIWSPLIQKATCGRNYLWVVKYADGTAQTKGDGYLRFELNKTSTEGTITKATTKELFQDMQKWHKHLNAFPIQFASGDGTGIPTCKDFYSNVPCGSGCAGNSAYIDQLPSEANCSVEGECVRTSMYAATFFIGIGDRCEPYSVFKTPRTGTDYQSTLIPWTHAGLIQQQQSPWFGMMFGSRECAPASVQTSCADPTPQHNNVACIC